MNLCDSRYKIVPQLDSLYRLSKAKNKSRAVPRLIYSIRIGLLKRRIRAITEEA